MCLLGGKTVPKRSYLGQHEAGRKGGFGFTWKWYKPLRQKSQKQQIRHAVLFNLSLNCHLLVFHYHNVPGHKRTWTSQTPQSDCQCVTQHANVKIVGYLLKL